MAGGMGGRMGSMMMTGRMGVKSPEMYLDIVSMQYKTILYLGLVTQCHI